MQAADAFIRTAQEEKWMLTLTFKPPPVAEAAAGGDLLAQAARTIADAAGTAAGILALTGAGAPMAAGLIN